MYAYIASIGLISPQHTCTGDFSCGVEYNHQNRVACIEPTYKEYINPVQLRRMSRILKLGLGAAQLCLHQIDGFSPDAIVVGTGLACVGDLELFLKSALEHEGANISPIPFINSSHNTVASQIARILSFRGYNNTFCHKHLSFEHALLDSLMLLHEQEAEQVLVGGVDEFDPALFGFWDHLGYWKKENEAVGAMAGEGAGFFLLHRNAQKPCIAKISAIKTLHGPLKQDTWVSFLLENGLQSKDIDTFVLGLNGHQKEDAPYQQLLATVIPPDAQIAAYKHLCGTYMTGTAFALAIAANALQSGAFPTSCIQRVGQKSKINKVLIYNQYWNQMHALILLEK